MGKIFGFFQKPRKKNIEEEKMKEIIQILLEIREDLRKKKLFELSDKIRDELKKVGIEIYDTPKGPKWKFV